MRYEGIEGRVAIVTGANHGIGAATAEALAGHGAYVLVSFLRVDDPASDGAPQAYRANRARDASRVVGSIREAGGRADALEADLRDPATPAAKAALENYAMSAALELGGYGITSNVVHPPVTDTGWVTDAVRAFVAASGDHFHVARSEDVADVIAYICSEHARLITANVVHLR